MRKEEGVSHTLEEYEISDDDLVPLALLDEVLE